MCSSSSSAPPPSTLFPPTTETPSLLLLRRRNASPFFTSPSFFLSSTQRSKTHTLRLSASLAQRNLDLSWSSSPDEKTDDYGGWAVVEPPVQKKKEKGSSSFLKFLMGGLSVCAVVAVIVHYSLQRRGRLWILNQNDSRVEQIADSGEYDGSNAVPESSQDSKADTVSNTVISERVERVIIPVALDSTQQEALSVLKRLKIIEDDVEADELCTRREYARWLIRIHSLLERNPRHRIVTSVSLSGSIICAFDDASVEDPDFGSIQALAEAGLNPSKLSSKNSISDGLIDKGGICFFPERFISRQDMINWKAQLEYEFMPGILEQISRTNVAFMDVKDISSDASPQLFMDMLAGDRSIIRKVFGQSKRFQPSKPSTKAQAAVALISGRMMGLISTELLRLEAEASSRQAAMEEIRTEVLGGGVIQKFWYEKLEEEKAHGVEVEKVYLAALHDLEEEKIVQEKIFAEHVKEKSAMDCQRQLLASLKEEVDEMSERLACEKTMNIDEQHDLRGMYSNLQTKLEELLDAKSVLEAEKEAIRILRSWVEDEARKSQARAKVLEEVGRRWKWDDQTGQP